MYRSPTRRWVDPRCTVLDLPEGIIGPFVELDDGGLLTVKDGAVRRSHDDGKSWSAPEPIHDGQGPGVPSSGLLLRTQRGVIVLVYVDNSNFFWFWDDSTRRPAENVRSNVWDRKKRGRRAHVDRPPDDHGGVQRSPDHHDRDAQRQDRRPRPEAVVQPRSPRNPHLRLRRRRQDLEGEQCHRPWR